ncbi:MAG TPA: hypothetical protein VFP67_06615 [Acidimicrobiia bacterium]|nr:hypothetical protein [Acidimicrobiia bacterium]
MTTDADQERTLQLLALPRAKACGSRTVTSALPAPTDGPTPGSSL